MSETPVCEVCKGLGWLIKPEGEVVTHGDELCPECGGTGEAPKEGTAKVWFVALCHDCEPLLPMPFDDPRERARWVTAHREATGHKVTIQDQREAGEAPTKESA